jgi:hypothetical protein
VSKLVGWNIGKNRRLDDMGDSMINHVNNFCKIYFLSRACNNIN